ncbi:MAG: antitoxin [Acidobacteriota bacterium]|nr:antitoxin [Acidobacteriota bacterium]
MGFGDKLKGFRDQAQQAVAENKDKIQGTLQNVGEAANTKTHGKYADKIARVGEKVSGSVEKIAGAGSASSQESAGAADTDAAAAPIVNEPDTPATPSAADEAASGAPPAFE